MTKTRKITPVFIAAVTVLICTLFVVMSQTTAYAADAWDGTTVASAFAGGEGTETSPYEISTPAQLAYLASATNGGTLDTSGKYFKLMADIDLNSKEWTPIGNDSNAFKGTFDGNGKVVKNLTITSASGCNGLFGYNEGTIKNVGIEGGSISGYIAGGVCGRNEGTISGCYNTAAVKGDRIGGICGENNDSDSTIQHCYNTGTVTGTSSYSYVGGICGVNGGGGSVEYCYNTGKVSTGEYVGGIAGHHSSGTISSSYYLQGTAEYCYIQSDMGEIYRSTYGVKTLAELCALDIDGTGTVWTLGSVTAGTANGNFRTDTVTLPYLTAFGADSAKAGGTVNKYNFNYNGTDNWLEYTPITTAAELQAIKDNLSGNYVLMNDIDLKDVTWTPLGSALTMFTGKFSGDGHVIKNLTLTDVDDAGLFAYNKGLIMNVGIESGSMSGTSAGGVCTYNYGTISGCYNNADITGNGQYAGGICRSNSGTIDNCLNTGSVNNAKVGSSLVCAGGIADLNNGTISSCVNIGSVSAKDRANAIVGYEGSSDGSGITNCYYLDSTAEYALCYNDEIGDEYYYSDSGKKTLAELCALDIDGTGTVWTVGSVTAGTANEKFSVVTYTLPSLTGVGTAQSILRTQYNYGASDTAMMEIELAANETLVIDGNSYTAANALTVYANLSTKDYITITKGDTTTVYKYENSAFNVVVLGTDFTITATATGTDLIYGTDYTYPADTGVLTVLSDKAITIANTDPNTATTDKIEVADGVSANITLAGVNIDVSGTSAAAAFKIADDSTGNVTITLANGTTNTLISGFGRAGLHKNGGSASGTLEIKGTGSLKAKGGYYGAGIGGGTTNAEMFSSHASNIIISGGTIIAEGGAYSAGIGGGNYGNGTNITISGSSVTASGSSGGAGIGGGYYGTGSDVTISGGSVTSSGSQYNSNYGGAGIGGGFSGEGSDIEISGGSVNAQDSFLSNSENAIGGGSGKPAVTPVNDKGENVYFILIPNPDSAAVTINGVNYTPVNHVAVNGDTNLYVYLPAKTAADPNVVKVGETTAKYIYDTANSKWLRVVDIPEADDTVFTYDGTEKTYTIAESDCYTVSGNKQTNAGTYAVTVTLAENTVWSDGTTEIKTYDFVIGKATPVITVTTDKPSDIAGKTIAVTTTAKNPNNEALTNIPAVTLTYKVGENGTETAFTGSFTIPEGTATGTEIIISAKTAEDSNYNSATGTAKVVVTDCTHTDKATEWTTDGTSHWHICNYCKAEVDKGAHVSSGAATATTAETCTVCGYEIAPATGSNSGEGGSEPDVPPVTTPSYTGRPSWVTTPSPTTTTTTTTTSTTTTTPPADDEEETQDDADEEVEVDEDTDTTKPADDENGEESDENDTTDESDETESSDIDGEASENEDDNPDTGVAIGFTGVIISAAAVMLTKKRINK